jgi:hypothetical protein
VTRQELDERRLSLAVASLGLLDYLAEDVSGVVVDQRADFGGELFGLPLPRPLRLPD